MAINYNEPVFTIGREPLVAGTIVVRNNLRLRKQRERRRHLEQIDCALPSKFGGVQAESSFRKAIAHARFALVRFLLSSEGISRKFDLSFTIVRPSSVPALWEGRF